jgi:hypothetical protein
MPSTGIGTHDAVVPASTGFMPQGPREADEACLAERVIDQHCAVQAADECSEKSAGEHVQHGAAIEAFGTDPNHAPANRVERRDAVFDRGVRPGRDHDQRRRLRRGGRPNTGAETDRAWAAWSSANRCAGATPSVSCDMCSAGAARMSLGAEAVASTAASTGRSATVAPPAGDASALFGARFQAVAAWSAHETVAGDRAACPIETDGSDFLKRTTGRQPGWPIGSAAADAVVVPDRFARVFAGLRVTVGW